MVKNRRMDLSDANELFERAVRLAYSIFTVPSDDHVAEIYFQLIWNRQHGLGEFGTGTLH